MKIKSIFNLLSILILCGCATWVAVGGNYKADLQNYQVELPDGWRKYNPATGELLITRDGFSLQHIQIIRSEIGAELPYTKKKLSKGMLPQEAAELIIDNIRSNPNILNQTFIENRPAQIGGHAGFKIVYAYQTKDGLNKNGALYGLLYGGWYYQIIYEAPERHYFSRDLPAFEKIKKSFRLIKEAVPESA